MSHGHLNVQVQDTHMHMLQRQEFIIGMHTWLIRQRVENSNLNKIIIFLLLNYISYREDPQIVRLLTKVPRWCEWVYWHIIKRMQCNPSSKTFLHIFYLLETQNIVVFQKLLFSQHGMAWLLITSESITRLHQLLHGTIIYTSWRVDAWTLYFCIL